MIKELITLDTRIMRKNSNAYLAKKEFFNQFITVFGRKPALEALETNNVEIYRLHLCHSNRPDPLLEKITQLASEKGAEIIFHSREALSRISKNRKQDQGVALDVKAEGFQELKDFMANPDPNYELLGLDRITNPQNLGMIIRSVCASPLTGLLLPRKGCANLDALVIKASAGTLFRARVIRCENMFSALTQLKNQNAKIIAMSANAKYRLTDFSDSSKKVFVLGNETDGLNTDIESLCTHEAKVPMRNGVESLNVAVTASLVAFRREI